MVFPAVYSSLHHFIDYQFAFLYHYLDPIEAHYTQSLTCSKWNIPFLFPWLIILSTTVYGNVLIPVVVAGLPLTWTDLLNSPALLFRQAYPQVIWPQTDIGMTIGTLGSLVIFASFWGNHWNIPRYKLNPKSEKLRIGKNKINRESSGQILNYHRRIKPLTFTALLIIIFFILIFLYLHIFYLNGFYKISIHLFICCFIFLPLYVLSVFYSKN